MTWTPGAWTPLALVAALLTVTAGFAGCIGTDETPALDPASSETPEPSNETTVGMASFEGSPSREVLWRNGSFAAQDNQITGDPDDSWVRTIDLTDTIPEGVLVRLNATLDFPRDDTERVFDNMEVELAAPEDTVLQRRNTDRTIPQYLTAAVLHEGEGPIELEVLNQWPTASTETEYTLRIEIATASSTIPARVPTSVEVPERASAIEIQPAEPDAELSTMAWDPDDGFAGWQAREDAASIRYPVDEAGRYVVRPDANAHLRVVDVDQAGETVAPAAPLEPLHVVTELGEGRVLPTGSGPETWTTNVTKAPIGVSFQVLPAGPGASGAIAGSDIRVQIATENGTVMDEPLVFPVNAFAADGPFVLDGLTGFPRTFADQNTTDDEWTWTAEYDLAAQVEIVPVWIYHQRGG